MIVERLRSSAGEPLELGRLLGRGGEARVYALAGDPRRAVKLYGRPDAWHARKLSAMIANVPEDPDRRAGHVSLVWPEALAFDSTGRMAGFVMPRIDDKRYLPLHQLYHPRSRRRRAPGMSWRYLVRIARNLSATLASLHESGYVVGDLNESNILVDDRALVTLVDLDSVQVAAGGRVFRCTVGKGEYTPPELQGRSFREVTRQPSSDRFGLAILTFLLLMEGNHPFSGVYQGEGEPAPLEENILRRHSPYFGRGPLALPPAAPSSRILGPQVAALLKRALLAPPWRRPDARAFVQALGRLEEELTDCAVDPQHAYRGGLRQCPWCLRQRELGERLVSLGPDPGRGSAKQPSETRVTGRIAPATTARPGTAARNAGSVPATRSRAATPTSPRAAPGRGFRGSWLQFHSLLPVVTSLLALLMTVPVALLWPGLQALIGSAGLAPAAASTVAAVIGLTPILASDLGLYREAGRSARLASSLIAAERLLRAGVTATFLSFAASLAAGWLLGRGSVLAGDWLLLPTFWVVTFAVALRLLDQHRA